MEITAADISMSHLYLYPNQKKYIYKVSVDKTRGLLGRIRGMHKQLRQIVQLQGTTTMGKLRKMGRDYQKDKNKKRLFLIINATKFASGNTEAL